MLIEEFMQSNRENVLTISAGEPIIEAARVLSRPHVEFLVVLGDDRRVAGVLSERDIVRGVVTVGEKVGQVKVQELMTRNFAFCGPDDTAETAAAVMSRRQVRHLPVVVSGVLLGLIIESQRRTML
jgi:CBS domain-containing protein